MATKTKPMATAIDKTERPRASKTPPKINKNSTKNFPNKPGSATRTRPVAPQSTQGNNYVNQQVKSAAQARTPPTAKPTPSTAAKPTPSTAAKPTPSATGSTTPPKGPPAANTKPTPTGKTPSKLGPRLLTRALPAALAGGFVGDQLSETSGAQSVQGVVGDATNSALGMFGRQSNDELSNSMLSGNPQQSAAAQAEVARRRDDPSWYEANGWLGKAVDNNFGAAGGDTTFNQGVVSSIGNMWDSLVGNVDPATSAVAGAAPNIKPDQPEKYAYNERGDSDQGPTQQPPKLGYAQPGDSRVGSALKNTVQSQNGFKGIDPNDPNGSALAARVSGGEPGDAQYALQQGALANAIRQRSIDENRGNFAVVGADTGPTLAQINQQMFDNAQDIANTLPSQADERNRLNIANESLASQARSMTNAQGYGQTASSSQYATDMRTGLAVAKEEEDNRQFRERQDLAIQVEDRMRTQMEAGQQVSASDILEIGQLGEPRLQIPLLEAALENASGGNANMILAMLEDVSGGTENFAEGGLIEQYEGGGMVPPNVGGQGMSAMRGAQQAQPSQADIANYQRYAAKAQEMGLGSIAFDEYITMKGGTENFAEGGVVPDSPDAAGKMLVDPNPQAGIDSIPAVIDGNRPAKMNSGEFVIPTDVVLFYGTDKLTKMIEKARVTGEPENANSAIGGATGA